MKIRYWDRVAVDARLVKTYVKHSPVPLAVLLSTYVLWVGCVAGHWPWWVILIPIGVPLAGLTLASWVATAIAVGADVKMRVDRRRARRFVGYPRSALLAGVL